MNISNIFLISVLLFVAFADIIFSKFKKQSNSKDLVPSDFQSNNNKFPKNKILSKNSVLFISLTLIVGISLFLNLSPLTITGQLSDLLGTNKIVVSELIVFFGIILFFTLTSIGFKFKGIPIKKIIARELLYFFLIVFSIPLIYFAHSTINSLSKNYINDYFLLEKDMSRPNTKIQISSNNYQTFNSSYYLDAIDLGFSVDSIQAFQNDYSNVIIKFEKRNGIRFIRSENLKNSFEEIENFTNKFGSLNRINEYEPNFQINKQELLYNGKKIISDYNQIAYNYTLGKFIVDGIKVNEGPLSYQLKIYNLKEDVRKVGNSLIKIKYQTIDEFKKSKGWSHLSTTRLEDYSSGIHEKWVQQRSQKRWRSYASQDYLDHGSGLGHDRKNDLYIYETYNKQWWSYEGYLKEHFYNSVYYTGIKRRYNGSKFPNGNKKICEYFECTYSKTIKNYNIDFKYIPSSYEKFLSFPLLIDSDEKNKLKEEHKLSEKQINEMYKPVMYYFIKNFNPNKIDNIKHSVLQEQKPSFKNSALFVFGLAYGYRSFIIVLLLIKNILIWAIRNYKEEVNEN
jgi:hypothetical protein